MQAVFSEFWVSLVSFLRMSDFSFVSSDCLVEILNASNLPQPPTASSSLDVIPSKLSYDTSYERRPLSDADRQTPESWPDDLLSLPMAVEDLGSLPIYGSLDSLSLEKAIGGSDFTHTPSFNFANPYGNPPLSEEMDTDHYLCAIYIVLERRAS
jgi:hypothetical protein